MAHNVISETVLEGDAGLCVRSAVSLIMTQRRTSLSACELQMHGRVYWSCSRREDRCTLSKQLRQRRHARNIKAVIKHCAFSARCIYRCGPTLMSWIRNQLEDTAAAAATHQWIAFICLTSQIKWSISENEEFENLISQDTIKWDWIVQWLTPQRNGIGIKMQKNGK